jgi:hypothetical protein
MGKFGKLAALQLALDQAEWADGLGAGLSGLPIGCGLGAAATALRHGGRPFTYGFAELKTKLQIAVLTVKQGGFFCNQPLFFQRDSLEILMLF